MSATLSLNMAKSGTNGDQDHSTHGHTGRKLGAHENVRFDPKLQPRRYEIKGMQYKKSLYIRLIVH